MPTLDDDGLITPEIGSWGEEKYRLVAHYAQMFAASMSGKWDDLVYLDLFAGAGRCRVRGTSRLILASPLAVLSNSAVFTKYVLCERHRKKADALAKRVRDYADRDVHVVHGDANALVQEVKGMIPQASRSRSVLCFCFADPYALSNLHFATISALSKRFVDFLILIPTGMDANRNIDRYYTRLSSRVLDRFLGDQEWRPRWDEARRKGQSADMFVTREYGRQMSKLAYLDPGAKHTHLIRSDEKNLALYRLALYSRHPLAQKFWTQSRRYTTPQLPLL